MKEMLYIDLWVSGMFTCTISVITLYIHLSLFFVTFVSKQVELCKNRQQHSEYNYTGLKITMVKTSNAPTNR